MNVNMKGLAKIAARQFTILFIVMSALLASLTQSYVVQLTADNMDDTLKNNELVFVNFYADWCRFSQVLKPIFEETAKRLEEEFPEKGKVVLGKVDCDREHGIAAQYHVNKYPTLKLFRHGNLVKREYRGQRSAPALSNFVKDQIKDPIIAVSSLEELDDLDKNKRTVIGYFDSNEGEDYKTYVKVAGALRDDCRFYAAVGAVSETERVTGNRIIYKPLNQGDSNYIPYAGNLRDFNILKMWATDKCVPVVREITFENAEELTEEGLPFMILFHHPDDKETPEKFTQVVSKELLPEKNGINFLTADGLKFSHPLYHLGKSQNDLPVVAIDSFRHMYIFPHDTRTDLDRPGLLKQFIADLHSGKLHREFHHGPDSTPAVPTQQPAGSHIPKEEREKQAVPTTPPESTFIKLAPSRSRYTLLRDEL